MAPSPAASWRSLTERFGANHAVAMAKPQQIAWELLYQSFWDTKLQVYYKLYHVQSYYLFKN